MSCWNRLGSLSLEHLNSHKVKLKVSNLGDMCLNEFLLEQFVCVVFLVHHGLVQFLFLLTD